MVEENLFLAKIILIIIIIFICQTHKHKFYKTYTVMLKENRNMCESKEHMLSSQVPPHPIQSKNKVYIYIN